LYAEIHRLFGSGEGGGAWMTGYLSGFEGSKRWHMLKRSLPQMFQQEGEPGLRAGGLPMGLKHVYFPVDVAGILLTALKESEKEMQAARICIDFMTEPTARVNPLYRASLNLERFIKKASTYNHDTVWHLDQYCLRSHPFVHIFKAPADMSAADLKKVWRDQLRKVRPKVPKPKPRPPRPTAVPLPLALPLSADAGLGLGLDPAYAYSYSAPSLLDATDPALASGPGLGLGLQPANGDLYHETPAPPLLPASDSVPAPVVAPRPARAPVSAPAPAPASEPPAPSPEELGKCTLRTLILKTRIPVKYFPDPPPPRPRPAKPSKRRAPGQGAARGRGGKRSAHQSGCAAAKSAPAVKGTWRTLSLHDPSAAPAAALADSDPEPVSVPPRKRARKPAPAPAPAPPALPSATAGHGSDPEEDCEALPTSGTWRTLSLQVKKGHTA
jgi:hypothetical protein